MPAVVLRNRDELRPRAGAIDADALCVRAKMTPSGQAIAAMSAGDVTLADDQIAAGETFYVIADAIDNADKLVADRHRHRNRFLRPGIPVVDVHVGPADRRFQDANQHVVAADFWNRNFLQPEPRLGFGFHDRFHRLLHERKLGESGKREKIFASAEAASLCIKGPRHCA